MHSAHRHGVVCDNEIARVGLLDHSVEKVAEALDIGVVEWSIDLIKHADRRRVGEEDGEDQSDGGESLLAARQ